MTADASEKSSPPSTRKRKPSKPAHDGWNGQQVYADEPVTGFYRVTVRVEGCGWVSVPARLWLISGIRDEANDLLEDEVFGAHVAGKPMDVDEFWPAKAKHRITEDEYVTLCEGNERWKHLIPSQS